MCSFVSINKAISHAILWGNYYKMSTEEQYPITNEHWQMVLSAIPEITQDTGEDDFRTLFSPFTAMAGDKISARGLYLVISGEVSLKLNDEELATASH